MCARGSCTPVLVNLGRRVLPAAGPNFIRTSSYLLNIIRHWSYYSSSRDPVPPDILVPELYTDLQSSPPAVTLPTISFVTYLGQLRHFVRAKKDRGQTTNSAACLICRQRGRRRSYRIRDCETEHSRTAQYSIRQA